MMKDNTSNLFTQGLSQQPNPFFASSQDSEGQLLPIPPTFGLSGSQPLSANSSQTSIFTGNPYINPNVEFLFGPIPSASSEKTSSGAFPPPRWVPSLTTEFADRTTREKGQKNVARNAVDEVLALPENSHLLSFYNDRKANITNCDLATIELNWLNIFREVDKVYDKTIQIKAMARITWDIDPAMRAKYNDNIESLNSKILYSLGRIGKRSRRGKKKDTSDSEESLKTIKKGKDSQRPILKLKKSPKGRKPTHKDQEIIDHVKLIKERNDELMAQGLAPLKKSAWESFLIGYKALNSDSEVKVIQNSQLKRRFVEIMTKASAGLSLEVRETREELIELARALDVLVASEFEVNEEGPLSELST